MMRKQKNINVNWERDDACCTIQSDYGRAEFTYKNEKAYTITAFKIDSNVICKGKGRELMEKIFQEVRNKGAKYLYVIPDSEVCRDGIELSEALHLTTSHKNENPQLYIENRYKEYGFKKDNPCSDGSSHWWFKKDLEE